jgi:hypothetical protein
MNVQQVVQALAELLPGVRVDLYTTFSHGTKGTRMRALVALTRGPASLDEFRWVWTALNSRSGLLGPLAPDQVTHDLTRGHAWPSARIGVVPEYHRLPGIALDTGALAAFARTLPTTPRTAPARQHAPRPAEVGLHALTRLDLLQYADHAARTSKPTLQAAINVLNGRPVAAQGQRYTSTRDLLASLWHWVRREHGAWLDPDRLWEVFGPSCAAMAPTADIPPDETWLANLVCGYAAKGEARHQATLAAVRRTLLKQDAETALAGIPAILK